MDRRARPLFTHPLTMYLDDKSYATRLALYSDGSERMAGAGFSGEIIEVQDNDDETVTLTTRGRWYGKIRTIVIARQGWQEFRERVGNHHIVSNASERNHAAPHEFATE